ncbi:beta strand repeat-containing protein [Nostoc linckia]|uniref:beta strand repeat-containing protein n=1 Tax=Nostoc linckia TaxID=92942 RepID=UPI000BFFF0B2|nr:FG-GAP-like repeat-containing protein [Nostoc linckia]
MTNPASFDPAVNYGVAPNPLTVTVGDFNGDGISDLVTSSNTSTNVSVLLGNGDGTFGTATNFNAIQPPSSVAIGDFNGDGISDLVTANSGFPTLSLLLGNGNGTFGTASSISAGGGAQHVAIGDFNGDGFSDLVTSNFSNNNLSVLLGNGDGTFGSATNYAVTNLPQHVAIGDFNGDGISDLVAPNTLTNNVSVLLGNGDGTFSSATNYAAGTRPTNVAIGDFNGDGFSDLATTNNGSNNISVLLGNGNGTFGTATNFAVGISPRGIAVGDFNGDGFSDLAVTNTSSGNLSVLLGNGDGSFGAATNFATTSFNRGIAVGDFNGDGKPDLVTANQNSNGSISVLLNTTPSNVSITAQTATANEGGSNGVYRVSRSDTGGALTINLTIDGSSTAATGDYTLSGGSVSVSGNTLTVTIADGQSFVDLDLAAIDDIQAEADETLKLNLDTGTGYTVDGTNNTATVTIAANDTVVTNTNDSGEGSLRQAILNANALAGANTITFAGSVFTDATPDTITLTSGQLTITDDVTIEGTGANQLTVSGNNASRVFNISNAGTDAIIDALTIANGNSANGGGIAISSGASLVLTDSTVSNNSSGLGFGGAGIANTGGTVNVINSTISGNTSTTFGGGIASQGTLTVTNSTISGNTASTGGGLIVAGVVTLTSSTITNNTAGNGGGLFAASGTTTARNTIIAGNNGNDIFGTVTGNANNLIGSLSGASGTIGTGSDITFASAGITNINQVIAALANNGGTTQTHALVAGSAAINAGNNALVTPGVTTDQRGTGFNRISGGTVDIGAYEVQNNNPTATNDSVTTNEDNAVNGNVLTNDTDPDTGDILTVSAVNGNAADVGNQITLASGALLTLNSDGSYNYNPNGQFESLAVSATANDSFTYTISDGSLTSTATVNLTINGVNDAPTVANAIANQTTLEDGFFSFTVPANTFADVDAGDSLTYTATLANGNPLPTWLSFNANTRTFSGTPDDPDNGTISIKVTASDTSNASANTTFNLTVTPVNDAPVAGDDSVSANQNTPLTLLATTLLANDTDVDSSTLSISAVSNAVNGSVSLNNSGNVVFTPTAGFTGNGSFNYTLSDGNGGTDVATVTVAVGVNLNGTNNNDNLNGTSGNDIINGLNAQDTISGNAGDDCLVGDNGDDLLYGNTGNDKLLGGNGQDTLYGDAGNDRLEGDNGDDKLYGGDGNDSLIGGNGQDLLVGGAGNDFLDGDKGDDNLTGGTGSDIFVLEKAAGRETITDFSLGEGDKIGLSGLSFSQLSFSGNQISLGNQTLAVLTGFNTTTLTQSNFVSV